MQDDELIHEPDPASRPGGRLAERIVVGTFLAVLAGTALVDALAPLPGPELEGQEQEEEEARQSEARVLDGSWSRLVERERRIHSRVRAWVSTPYAAALLILLDEAGEKVVVGREGWLFMRDRVHLDNPGELADSERAAFGASLFATLERWLWMQGCSLVLVPVTRKESLCEAFLPGGRDPHPEIDEDLVRELRLRGVRCVDMPRLFAGVPADGLYYRRGTHWTETTVERVAEEAARIGGFLAPPGARLGRLVPVEIPASRQDLALLRFIGMRFSDAGFERFHDDGVLGVDVVLPDGGVLGPPPGDRFGRVTLVGTSFSRDYGMAPLLSHFAGQEVGMYASRGLFELSSLMRLLRDRATTGLPEVVVLETPTTSTLNKRPLPPLGNVLCSLPAPDMRRLGVSEGVEAYVPLGEAKAIGDRRIFLAHLPFGRLFRSGDGVAAVRLVGRVEGELEVEVVSLMGTALNRSDLGVRATWPQGADSLVLPIASGGATANRFMVLGRARGGGTASLTLERVEAVAVAAPDGGIEARVEPPLDTEAGWAQTLLFPAGTEVPDHAVLLLELGVEGLAPHDFAASTIELVPLGPPDALPVELRETAPDATVVVGLTREAGRPLLGLELRGTGKRPTALVRRAELLRGPR